MYCLFCFTEFFDCGKSPAELDSWRKNRQTICKSFYKSVHRELDVQPKSVLGKDALEGCCNNCLHLINNFSKLAFQKHCIQLRLNWQTAQLVKVLNSADSNAENHKRFREHFINSTDVPAICRFRKEVIEKGANKLRRREPFILLDKLKQETNAAIHTGNITIEHGRPNSPPQQNDCIENAQVMVTGDTTGDIWNIRDHPILIAQSSDTRAVDADENYLENVDSNTQMLKISAVTSLYCDVNAKNTHKQPGVVIENDKDGNHSVLLKTDVSDSNNCSFYQDSDISQVMLLEPKEEVCEVDDLQDASDIDSFLTSGAAISFSQESDNADETFYTNYQTEPVNLTTHSNFVEGDFILSSNDTDYNEHDVTNSPFVCQISGFKKPFDNESSYQKHRNAHKEASEKWICEKCNTQYSTKFNLRRHLRRLHQSEGSMNIQRPMKKQSKPHRKPNRVILFGSLHKTVKGDQSFRHVFRWRNPEYSCGVCQKVCRNSFKLNEHMRTHSGERPYACAFCTWRFATKSNLKRHARLVHKLNEVFANRPEN